MELGSDENMGKENVPKCGHDPKQNLQQMLQRQANFIKTCRTVKVCKTTCCFLDYPTVYCQFDYFILKGSA